MKTVIRLVSAACLFITLVLANTAASHKEWSDAWPFVVLGIVNAWVFLSALEYSKEVDE